MFHKEDFKEYYEEQKVEEKKDLNDEESKLDKSSKMAENIPNDLKIDIAEEAKECKH